MRIVSWNVNGIRAWTKRGGLDWLAERRPDIFCIQETKATESQLAEEDHARISQLGYHGAWHSATRAGYSGVATFCLAKPRFVTRGVDFERDEGRVIITEHGEFTLYNVYFPNGRQREDGPDPERIAFKLEFYDLLLAQLEEERSLGKNLVVSGDWNTAHCELDLARPKENEGTTGFLPIEREALQRYVDAGYVDTFRHFHPAAMYAGVDPRKRPYSWWTYRAGARDRNIGWRIDYHFVNREYLPRVRGADIWSEVPGSDHAPVVVDLAV
jgi:exodeoxyribonuclease-3